MKFVLIRMGFVLLMIAGALGQTQQTQPSSPAAQAYRISGTLLNSTTGQPLVGASVAIAPVNHEGNDEISRVIVTGPDGHFSFAALRHGKYSLMARARGFSLQYFQGHDYYSTAVAVGPDLDSEHLLFRLNPDAAIEGVISDENGDPVHNAMVRLFETTIEDGQRKTVPTEMRQSDDQGHYRIGHLSAGTYYIAVSARPWYAQNGRFVAGSSGNVPEGASQRSQEAAVLNVTYPLTFYPGATDWAAASPIALHAGERSNADVVLRAVPALHLRIRTGNLANDGSLGRAVFPRVSQRLFEGYLNHVFNTPVSWPEPSVVEISDLAPGRYVIEMPASGGNGKNGSRGWYQELDLTSDAEVTAAASPEFASVSGSVVFDGLSRASAHAWVQLFNPETGERFRADISSQGQFDFKDDEIRPGRYEFGLYSDEHFFLRKISAAGARILGRILEITAAGNVRVSASAARGMAHLEGVALRNGKPFAGAMIVLVPQDPANNAPLFRRDQSDSDGTFTLPGVLPGQYTVLAIADGWNVEWGNPVALQPYMNGGEPVQITGDGELQIKVPVQ